MVQRPNCLLQDSTTMSLNNKMYSRLPCKGTDRLLENEKKIPTRTSFLANKQKTSNSYFLFYLKNVKIVSTKYTLTRNYTSMYSEV